MTKPIIKLENIDITFYQKRRTIEAVKDVSITINKGNIYGIVGYSGAGKSTLVRTINLLQPPTSGTITIGDDVTFSDGQVQLKGAKLRQKRQKIGMIFQHFNLMSQKTARQNVAFALRHSSLSKEEKDKKVSELLELVGLSERAENYPSQLSGGQKQRVAIARALANDPEILISDESTSALDPKTTKQILTLLQDLNQKLGLTVVMITHEMQIVKDICHRVAVMQNGHLIEEGSVLDIFTSPKEALTQEFIKTATGIDEALVKIEKQDFIQTLPKNDLLVQLKYSGRSTDEPILNQIYKEFEVTANILYGNIEILADTPVGEMIVVLSGEPDALMGAQKAIVKAGIDLTVLKRGA
ncbi:methionine ABC transporter ATP-binding protein [Streptococcus alactolyticus]|jgi:D-methionine transport system ATP-binding protein|uniref:Methionine ABC transporter ATP-binding protein n=1 Tax=Streptococcus alactolyticus TaxID=29389 RepID=A0A6N7X4K0_STRAY|nr:MULTISPECIES: methionine ABC transporter ATP-binding protein [Streptococcus]MDE2587217.1 methionine ABC transporter ATP-binding protein [Lactobacillales bacterium]MCF2666036.1 methionine ABC transporter ATP-binding protein [Streptococcus alactolyticus]MCF2678136.1 methionine ABC transporter ATP-binding protein [Streptococcus alactolyticus]MCI6904302.1 methionine ABC transporter ATP-binding protein [Streptococcus alactolyticus]MDD7361473.1 methionine ABC transporter ATP-binding protein [Stre